MLYISFGIPYKKYNRQLDKDSFDRLKKNFKLTKDPNFSYYPKYKIKEKRDDYNCQVQIPDTSYKITIDVKKTIFLKNTLIFFEHHHRNKTNYKCILILESSPKSLIQYMYTMNYYLYLTNHDNIANRPLEMERKNLYTIGRGYSVTEKSDGLHAFLMNNKKKAVLTFKVKTEKLKPDNITQKLTIVEGEYLSKNKTFYIFDCLFYGGKNITNLDLVKRHDYAKKYVKEQSYPKTSIKLVMKKFYYQSISKDIKNLCHGAYKIYNERKKNSPPIDGLVYNPLEGGYYAYPILKWKPLHHKTVDFLLIKQSPKKVGLYVLTNHKNNNKILFNWMNKTNPPRTYAKLVRTESIPESEYEDESVYEMEYNQEKDKWSIKMLRNNKNQAYKNYKKNGVLQGPNFITTYNSIVNYFKNPIKDEEIMCEKDDQYYQNINYSKTKTQGLRNYHQWLKTQLYKKYIKKGNRVLEIAGGRGGDLKKTLNRNINYLLISNINKEGLVKAKGKAGKMKKNIKINILEANASKNITKEIKSLAKDKFDVVSVQMAFHYFLKNKTSLKNIFKNIDSNLKEGGYFMATFIDGNRVTSHKNKKIEFISNNKPIFIIEKLYNKQKDLGSEIKVFGETFGWQNEYLVNLEFIKEFFLNKGYKLIEQNSFESLYNIYKKSNNKNRNFIEMTNGEKGYSFLFTTLVLQKK